jgi:hypothetical protein
MTSEQPPSAAVDPSTAHPARRYDYWLGGKDNFAADRASAHAIEAIYPHIRTTAVENRRFLHRAVTHLARDRGVTQFLDIGIGLPTADNTHQIAQRHQPAARIVYVDNDPLVLVHARALLTSTPEGRTAYLHGDLNQPETILQHADLIGTVDLDRPVALLLVAVLHFLADTQHAYDVVHTLAAALAPGSYLVVSHATYDVLPPATAEQLATADVPGRGTFTARTRTEIARFLGGLTVLPPGLTVVSRWRPDPGTALPADHEVAAYGAVARIPSRPTP